jgi:hypothetical protein
MADPLRPAIPQERRCCGKVDLGWLASRRILDCCVDEGGDTFV